MAQDQPSLTPPELDPTEFDREFDRVTHSAFRLEARPYYSVDEEDDLLSAIARGEPRPERSIVTCPWLARIARTTLAGVLWSRVRVVEDPPTGYQLDQLLHAYVESQTAGERIYAVYRRSLPRFPGADFWLLDRGTDHARVIVMDYDYESRWLGAHLLTHPDVVAEFDARRRALTPFTKPLNVFVAGMMRYA